MGTITLGVDLAKGFYPYGLRTEQAYVGRIRRFILASGKRRPHDMGAAEVEAFPDALAIQGQAAAGARNQARPAWPFRVGRLSAPDALAPASAG